MKFFHDIKIFLLAIVLVSVAAVAAQGPIYWWQIINSKLSFAAESTSSSASVGDNPYNTLAMQLQKKELTLEEREMLLNKKESEILNANSGQKNLLMIMVGGIVLLFCLILFNYYLDYQRKRNGS